MNKMLQELKPYIDKLKVDSQEFNELIVKLTQKSAEMNNDFIRFLIEWIKREE